MTLIPILQAEEAGRLLGRKAARFDEAEQVVRPILAAVKKRGDAAVMEYARRFDGFDRAELRLPLGEVFGASGRVSSDFKRAMNQAARNIRKFAKLQMPVAKTKQLSPGLQAGQIIRPLDVVACYVPSGRYPLPSTVLMTALTAQVAGVRRVCVTTPKPVPEILAAAQTASVSDVFLMGGAHAIAAFAYGTKTVPKADRIVGPGNIYVAAAKKLLAGEVGIDFVAGPTEILIIADEGNPDWIAADMLAQAEHDPDASAILLTTSKKLALAVQKAIAGQLVSLPTAATAKVAIENNSAVILVPSLEDACHLSNSFAPEHLSLHDPELLPLIRHAGGIFLGPMSPEAAGDYAAGPNHVLPTSGAARLRGGLSAADFVKVIATQSLDIKALKRLAPAITTLARAEGLEAHARSVEVRLK